jgi:putative RecB family exonuclease
MTEEELRLSVSKTKCFSQCRKQYEFGYILKLPKKDRDYHIFGKFCHRVLEAFHNYYIEGCLLPYNIAMTDAFKIAWSEYKDKMTPEMKKECWVIIDKYLRLVTKDKKNNLPANVISCEKRFELPLNDKIVLNGAIDRIQLDADNVVHVADYKTVKNKKYLKNDWFQLLTYAYVIVSEDPEIERVRASYILLRHDFEYITTEFSVDEIMRVKDQYVEYARQILTEKDFEPTPSALCSYCDFLEHCPAGKSKAFGQAIYGEVNW